MFNDLYTNRRKQILIVFVVLTVLTLAVYGQVYQFDFINMDDYAYVKENLNIRSGINLEGLRWAISTRYFDGWHPPVWLSFLFDYQCHGLNAGGYHLTNVFFHISATLLLFWCFGRMTGSVWKSAFVAAFFALHPLHVESVAQVAERKDVLSAFFWMLTLCLYVYYTEKPGRLRYLFMLLSFICGLMSKPMVVTLPLIMIMMDYWPLKRFDSQKKNWIIWQFREKSFFLILSAIFSIATIAEQNNFAWKQFQSAIPFDYRVAHAPVAFLIYLKNTFWPHDLAAFYPMPDQIFHWHVLGAFLFTALVSVFVLVVMKRLPFLFVGWLWYVVTLLPVIGIIQYGPCSIADHYTYLPSIGISVMLAWGVPSLIEKKYIRKRILFSLGIIFLMILAVLTRQQCSYWKNSISLWNHSLTVTKDNAFAHKHLAFAMLEKGKVEKAIAHYTEAIRISSDEDIFAYTGRGAAYAMLGQHQRAIEDFKETIRLMPGYAPGYYNLGLTYASLGRSQRAIEEYSKAIRLKPDFVLAYINRGVTYLSQGSKVVGCDDVQKACGLGYCSALNWAKSQGLCN